MSQVVDSDCLRERKGRLPVVLVASLRQVGSYLSSFTASTQGDKFVHCKLCRSHFSVAHGGFNDVTRHVQGLSHQQRLKDTQSTSTIASVLSRSQTEADVSPKVMSAEIITFQSADHLSDLV